MFVGAIDLDEQHEAFCSCEGSCSCLCLASGGDSEAVEVDLDEQQLLFGLALFA